MKGVRILVSLTLGVLWLAGGLWLPAGLLGPGSPEVRAAEPGEVPGGLTAAEWQTLQGQLAKLTAGGGEPEDWFGWSVAVGPDIIVVGAPGVDVDGNENEGAAYLFYRDEGGAGNWGPVVRLTAADGAAGDNFGFSVAIDGPSDIVVGSPLADPGGELDRGAAYVFAQDEGGDDAWGQVAKLTASDGDPDDQFGYSVSLWTESSEFVAAVVGAPFADVSGRADQGAAYVFEPDEGGPGAWGQAAKLTAGDGAADDYFGGSVSYHNGIALVGADSADVGGNADQGAAYVFYRDLTGTWAQVSKLTAADGGPDDSFGYSVSVNIYTALVGARNADPNGSYLQGAAYIFHRDQGGAHAWGQVARLTAADGAAEDRLGWAVSLYGDTAVVGAPYAHVSGIWDEGAAYVFRRDQGGANTWGQLTKVTGTDAGSGDQTGSSVSIYSGTAVVGAGLADISDELDQGAAYVYERNQGGANAWGQTATLAVANGWHEDNFGLSVAVDGDTAIVGAYRADVGGNADQGAAYVFERDRGGADAWRPVATLLALDGAAGDAFGGSVSISANYALVGAPYAHVDGYQDRGAAYLFLWLPGIPWGQGAKYVVAEGNANDHFGSSVSIDGRTIVIGADAADVAGTPGVGAAYVWDMDPGGLWHRMATLTATDGEFGDSFGHSVSLSGDTAVVGARYAGPGGSYRRGAAYIFDRDQGGPDMWGQVAWLTAADGAAIDMFGWSVSLSGDTAVIGAPSADVSEGQDRGAAYVFDRDRGGANAWGQDAKLSRAGGAAEDCFGWSVSVDGSRAVVGAPGVDVGTDQNKGAAYVFDRSGSTWGPSSTLTAADGAMGDNFGSSVSASGGTVIAGAYLADIGPMVDQGAAYVYAVSFRVYLPVVVRNRG
jgi:hypothetical protein